MGRTGGLCIGAVVLLVARATAEPARASCAWAAEERVRLQTSATRGCFVRRLSRQPPHPRRPQQGGERIIDISMALHAGSVVMGSDAGLGGFRSLRQAKASPGACACVSTQRAGELPTESWGGRAGPGRHLQRVDAGRVLRAHRHARGRAQPLCGGAQRAAGCALAPQALSARVAAAARPGLVQAALQAGRGVETLDLSVLTGTPPLPGPPALAAGRRLTGRALGRANACPGGPRRREHHRSARGRPRPRPRAPSPLTGAAPKRRGCRRSGSTGGAPHPGRHRARHLQDAQHAAVRARLPAGRRAKLATPGR